MHDRKGPSVVYWLGKNLYLNITNRCSNDCYFCVRKFRNGIGGFILKLREDPLPTKVIEELQSIINIKDWEEIVFCGFGEPTCRLDCILTVCRWIRRYYGKASRVRVDTNGHGFLLNEGRDVLRELKEASVDRISVSLNANDEDSYNQICRPIFSNAFKCVLEFVKRAKSMFDVEVTAVAIPEVDAQKIAKIASDTGVKFRLRKYIAYL